MDTHILNLARPAAALFSGGIIGFGFGIVQNAALRRHQKLQAEGKFTAGWATMPGSFKRIAYLLVALALIQFLCPILFEPGSINPWCVSAGLVLGYGWILYGQLRTRLS